MYIGIDIGGTKTLAGVFSDDGQLTDSKKFPTPQDYDAFQSNIAEVVASFATRDFRGAGLAMPVTVFNRDTGIGVNYANLAWKNVPIVRDIESLLHCPLVVDNDAKLACFSEAIELGDRYSKVLYVTVSTGIGYALTVDGVIDENAGDGGGKALSFEHNGKLVPWESFASGHAIVERYGKKAMDITDEPTWRRISQDLSRGFLELTAIFEPDVIVVGGSVGSYFDRFGSFLKEYLAGYQLPLVPMPDIIQAKRPEEAVLYGCFEAARRRYADT